MWPEKYEYYIDLHNYDPYVKYVELYIDIHRPEKNNLLIWSPKLDDTLGQLVDGGKFIDSSKFSDPPPFVAY